MGFVDVVAKLTSTFYMNKKLETDIGQIKNSNGLLEKDWQTFLNDKKRYPIETQTEIQAPNEIHVKLYDKDLEEIDRIREETGRLIEQKIPECVFLNYLDGGIEFHKQADIVSVTGENEVSLSTKLLYASPYLYGAGSGVDISLEAQAAFNNFLTLREETVKNVKVAQKGKTGEDNVSRVLRQYRDSFFSLENIVISAYQEKGNTAEIDACIISSKGIFICEVKNYGTSGQMLYMPEHGEWQLYNESGYFLANKPSAFVQNERQCNAARSFLKEHLGREVPIIPVVIIANNEVDVRMENPQSNIVIRADQINDLVSSFRDAIDYETQKNIVATFEKHQLDPNDFPVQINADRATYLKSVVEEYIPFMKANAKIADTYMRDVKQNKLISWGITLLLAAICLIPSFTEGEWLVAILGVIAWGLACITETKIGTIAGMAAVFLQPLWLVSRNPAYGGVSILCMILCFFTMSKGDD